MTVKTWQPSAAEVQVVKKFRSGRLSRRQAHAFQSARPSLAFYATRPSYVDAYHSPFANVPGNRVAERQLQPHMPGIETPEVIEAALHRAARITELQDDWDGEGSRGYTEDTISRAASVVCAIARRLSRPALERLGVVELTPGPDGSIDIEMVVGDKRLLINAAHDAVGPLMFYGHSTNRSFPIEGELRPNSSVRFLAEWLVA